MLTQKIHLKLTCRKRQVIFFLVVYWINFKVIVLLNSINLDENQRVINDRCKLIEK